MAKVILTKERRMADRIIRSLPKQTLVASELGVSPQKLNYRIKNVYPDEMAEFIKVIELAGYEIAERED